MYIDPTLPQIRELRKREQEIMYNGSGHLSCISESDIHNCHHHHRQDHGSHNRVLGKRPLSTAANAAQKKLMTTAPLPLSNHSSNFGTITSSNNCSQLLSAASFTIAFTQNASEEDDDFLMPRSSSSIASFQTRAKRGCATHPRSIAERNRRNRISERIRQLQKQLFPDIDKQTSTAEILEGAVDYVRSLRVEVQRLTDARTKCKCL